MPMESAARPALERPSEDLPELARALAAASDRVRQSGEVSAIGSSDLAALITAALKLYAAKAEADGTLPPPVVAEKITPTEVVVVVTEMLRAANLSLFDLAMWYRRPR